MPRPRKPLSKRRVVHVQEGTSSAGHAFDVIAMRPLLERCRDQAWREMRNEIGWLGVFFVAIGVVLLLLACIETWQAVALWNGEDGFVAGILLLFGWFPVWVGLGDLNWSRTGLGEL